ncbi:MAG: hypothetical protein GY821_00365, partial [Gammaproteobacteria bacterium]|nr:hypothetical protein [Gammaproteobacteria bacterium]
AVLKKGLKNESVNGPKPRAPTIRGQLPGLSRPLEEVREDIVAHKKSLIVIGIPEKESQGKEEKDPDVVALDQLFADCGSSADFEYDYERLGRKRHDGSARVLKVDFDSVAQVNSILAGKRNLKGKEEWAKVRIRRSLPLAERQALRLCFCRAAQLMAVREKRETKKRTLSTLCCPTCPFLESISAMEIRLTGFGLIRSWRNNCFKCALHRCFDFHRS